jgi:hypothetical protein
MATTQIGTAYITSLLNLALLYIIFKATLTVLRIHETMKRNDRLAFGELDEFNVRIMTTLLLVAVKSSEID